MVVLRGGEEDVRLTEQERLFFCFVADVEHRDVGPDASGLALPALRVGPDEPASGYPEIDPSRSISSTWDRALASRRTSSALAIAIPPVRPRARR